jgi:hypothetical protein
MVIKSISIIEKIVDVCKDDKVVQGVISSIENGPGYSSKAELVCQCLNKELSAYGFYSYPSADHTAILVNDDTMCNVLDFFKNNGYQPHITTQQVNRVKSIVEVASNDKINIFWQQAALKRKYYYLKQYGFNGWNLFNLLNINTINNAAASLSVTGAAKISMTGIVALSWSGSLFLSSLEYYIPDSMSRVKIAVMTTKFVISAPIRCVEWSGNQIMGGVEYLVLGHSLPTNVTEVFKLNEGPKLKDLKELKKPLINWMVNKLQKFNN